MSPATKTEFISNLSRSLFANLSKGFGEEEARRLAQQATSRFITDAVRKGTFGAVAQTGQQYLQNTANNAIQKATYKPEITWNDVFGIKPGELAGYKASGLLGVVGGSFEAITRRMSTQELANGESAIGKALRENRISEEDAATFRKTVEGELKKRKDNGRSPNDKVTPDEEEFSDLAKEEQEYIERANIAREYDKISRKGHAVHRHGEGVTRQQLIDRVTKGIDPVTGTTDDAYNKNPDGSPKKHNIGKTASKFNSKDALVKADEAIRKSDEFNKLVKEADKSRFKSLSISDIKLQDVFGRDYKKHVSGVTRLGTRKRPLGHKTTDFTDGTIRAFYTKDKDGSWNLETAYPEPNY